MSRARHSAVRREVGSSISGMPGAPLRAFVADDRDVTVREGARLPPMPRPRRLPAAATTGRASRLRRIQTRSWCCTAFSATPTTTWAAAWARVLKANDFCEFDLTYGKPLSFIPVGGITDVKVSAKVIAAFIDKVRAKTGADKVAVVGHSEGGFLRRTSPS